VDEDYQSHERPAHQRTHRPRMAPDWSRAHRTHLVNVFPRIVPLARLHSGGGAVRVNPRQRESAKVPRTLPNYSDAVHKLTKTKMETFLKNQKKQLDSLLDTIAVAPEEKELRDKFGFVPTPKAAPEQIDEPDSDNHEMVGHPNEEL
jgi:hypothetical protein